MTTVVAAVIEREERILIGQRRNTGPHALKWEFPGGKVEPSETPEDALIRELGEELAILAQAPNEIMRYEYQYAGRKPLLLVFFRVTRFEGEPRNLAFEQIQWVTRGELPEYDFLEGDAPFLASFQND